MLQKRLVFVLMTLLCAILATNVSAGWKEEQDSIFEKINVAPGDKITKGNWQKVKDILPPSVVDYVKNGDFILEIADMKWDYNNDEGWQKATSANAGRYDIDTDNGIIEKKTGKRPDFISGEPFPQIDVQNDPKSGAKIAWNAVLGFFRSGTVNLPWTVNWVGRGGLERSIEGNTLLRYYWGLSDGPIDNRSKFLQTEVVQVKKPYDVSGIVSLAQRFIAPSPDQVYSYVPSIRRVKKTSGTTRSSPFMGTDFVMDDTNGFYGKIENMTWKAVEKKIVLLPVPKWAADGPAKFVKQSDGSWKSPSDLQGTRHGFEIKDWEGAPWAPADFVWVPRMMYVVVSNAIDPYYNYGETTFYIDPVAGFTYKSVKDKAGTYWKTIIVAKVAAELDKKTTVCTAAWYGAFDDKSDHASLSNHIGQVQGRLCEQIYNDPNLTESIYSPTAMSALSR